MIVAWILYALLVGSLVAAAARGLERAFRLAGHPVRWIWAGAVALTLILVGVAPFRASLLAPQHSVAATSASMGTAAGAEDTSLAQQGPLAALNGARRDFDLWLQDALLVAESLVPAWLERGLVVLWLSLSGLLALVLWAAYRRVHRRLPDWPVLELHGVRVRVAPEVGPAVIGLRRPEVVVPRWLLSLSEPEQRLVLIHEREHLRARDPLVLLAACAGAVLLPWHPAVYWMLARLRLTVELDCDARVLSLGVPPRAYGTLLIDLAGRGSGFRVGTPAFADSSSHLERRLLAMKQPLPQLATVRGGALSVLALLGLLVACEAKLPTRAQVEEMDVAAAEQGARRASLLAHGDAEAMYTIDGSTASAEQARALLPDQIARIEIVKSSAPGERAQVRITTHALSDAPPPAGKAAVGITDVQEFNGIVLIDGVRADATAMRALSPERIKSVEVIKGPAASRAFVAPEAANGVIKISTHGGSAQD